MIISWEEEAKTIAPDKLEDWLNESYSISYDEWDKLPGGDLSINKAKKLLKKWDIEKKKYTKPTKIITKWFAIDENPDIMKDLILKIGLGATLEEAVKDFEGQNTKSTKKYAFKIELLGEVKQTLEIVK